MRKTYYNKTAFAWLSVTVAISAALLAFLNTNLSSSQAMAYECGSLSMNVTTPTGSGGGVITTALSGEADINITTPSAPHISQIIILANDKQIGQAQPSGTNNWLFKWATSLWPAGGNRTVTLTAKAIYADHTCPIISTMNPYYITTQQTSVLNLIASPSAWDGNINASQVFAVNSFTDPISNPAGSFDINPYGIYTWTQPTIGTLFNVTNTFLDKTHMNYSSGLIAGNGEITVKVIYGGVEKTIPIPITVKPLSTNATTQGGTVTETPSPIVTDTAKKAPALTTATTSVTTATQVTSSQVQVSAIAKSCIEAEITAERYAAIISNKSRPTAEEITKISNCFATSKYILPSSFSPIDPLKIENVTTDSAVASINKLENVTKTDNSVNKEVLKISGKAKPNTTVIIYVYSDPLVITTTSDEDGNWQYTLEDPLEPGKHEVYAVVNKGDGSYKRSDPLSFLISTVGATAGNPNGLSLKLNGTPTASATQSNSNLIYYVIGTICALAVALISLFIAIRIHLKHRIKPTPVNSIGNPEESNKPSDANNEINNIQSPIGDEPPTINQTTPTSDISIQPDDNVAIQTNYEENSDINRQK